MVLILRKYKIKTLNNIKFISKMRKIIFDEYTSHLMIPDTHHDLPPEVVETLRLIGRKWSVIMLHELTHNPMSFGELKDQIKGVSASVLSDLLSEFIDKEIIEKRSISISPPRSAYFITSFGSVLCDIIDSISNWGSELIGRKSMIKVEEIGDEV